MDYWTFPDNCPAIDTFLSKFFKFLNDCILFNIGLTVTKLEDFVKPGVFFPEYTGLVLLIP